MTKQIQAELLVIFLLFLGSIRYLFVKQTRKDSLSVVPFVGLLISFFNVFAFGVSFVDLVIFILSFWVSVWNFRSLLRLLSDVFIDHYEIKLILINTINAILCLAAFCGVMILRPADSSPAKMKVRENIHVYTGNFRDGIKVRDSDFSIPSANVWNFESDEKFPAGRIIVLFVPPKTADVETYRILLQKLAKSGYSVYAGDFWTDDGDWFNRILDMKFLRKFCFFNTKFKNAEEYGKILSSNQNVLVEEFSALLKIADAKDNDMVFLLTEDDVAESMKTTRSRNPGKIHGSFDLAYLDDNPSKGFGPVENTNPEIGVFLGLSPERSGYISSHMATEVMDFISRQIVDYE